MRDGSLRRESPGSPPDLRHRLARLDEPWLVDQVAFFLAPHSRLDDAAEVVARRARADELPQRSLLQREQARTQAALRGEPDSVARGAERLAHGGDEAHATRRAVGELEAGRRTGARVNHRLQREQVFDLLLDAP